MKTEGKNFKSVAKEAKMRLKKGFWQDYKSSLQDELARAKKEGMNESLVERYFAGKVTCTVKGMADDDAFYEKVKELLLTEGEVSDAIRAAHRPRIFCLFGVRGETALHSAPFRTLFKSAGTL